MIYAKITRGKNNEILLARVLTDNEVHARQTIAEVESRWDWKTFEDAKAVALALGDKYHATDAGSGVSPRYDVQTLPQIGDEVSYSFNGDYYPCGKITKISASKRRIEASDGSVFYRVRETGCWKKNDTWSLIAGHVDRRNPEF